ncbi:MAG: assimilatory sulfite reductase (NADPH) flavoprotein subunit [Bacillota bacterium]|nr:assimilatory sulfite reductase (NADPH) flavoprotein subunit [Bacillota bacterium]
MELQVINNPFSKEQAEALNQLLQTLTESQKIWLSSYLAASQTFLSSKPSNTEQSSKEVTILYGSQSGNARGLAGKAGKVLEDKGFLVNLSSMADFKPNHLKTIQNLLVIVSTHGEGDPPDTALLFYEYLHSKRAPKLDSIRFSVLSLGDSSYEFFCKTGKDFDIRLEQLGGTRLYPRFDCDVDYDEAAAEWLDGVLGSIGNQQNETSTVGHVSLPQEIGTEFSRTNPFKAEVLENLNLNGRGSNKETRHLELSLEGSGLTYEPGDALGIYPENDPELVGGLLAKLAWDSGETIVINRLGDILPLKEALTSFYEITVLTKPLLQKVSTLLTNKDLEALLLPENQEKLKEYIEGRDLLDFVHDFGPWGGSAQEFVSVLRKIPPRLYSIASSLSANPEEVHLTIGAVRYESHGRNRKGVSSCFCAERIQPGDRLSVYIQQNENFKLPSNPEAPIIMVGPGTGVAPFRSFLQEREEKGSNGKSWLFFGEQQFVTDFLYQIEWQKWLKSGVLTKMDVAFSRDKNKKVYVQHRMLEKIKELFKWLEEGAVVYICGDERNMAHDVHQTLIKVIEKEGNVSLEKAEEYLANMARQRRYQRDVY